MVPFLGWVKADLERMEELEFCSWDEILKGIVVEFYLLETKEELEFSEEDTLVFLGSKRNFELSSTWIPISFSPFEEEGLPFSSKYAFSSLSFSKVLQN